jgi:hypothetical protein
MPPELPPPHVLAPLIADRVWRDASKLVWQSKAGVIGLVLAQPSSGHRVAWVLLPIPADPTDAPTEP